MRALLVGFLAAEAKSATEVVADLRTGGYDAIVLGPHADAELEERVRVMLADRDVRFVHAGGGFVPDAAELPAEHDAAAMDGEVIRLGSPTLRLAPLLALGMLALALAGAALGTVDEYAEGPAIVRLENGHTILAQTEGVVTAVRATPGQRVRAGTVLLSLDSTRERAELERVEREFDLLLADRLRDPSDEDTESRLSALRAQRALARTMLDTRTIVSPCDATVSELRARTGQYVRVGDMLSSLATDRSTYRLIVLVPGRDRPRLARGQKIRFEVDGFARSYQTSSSSTVGNEVVGPEEAARFLGPELAHAVNVDGPVVVVEAPLRSRTFTARGERYAYHAGMLGRAQVRIDERSLVHALVPGLRSVFEEEP